MFFSSLFSHVYVLTYWSLRLSVVMVMDYDDDGCGCAFLRFVLFLMNTLDVMVSIWF